MSFRVFCRSIADLGRPKRRKLPIRLQSRMLPERRRL
jgi:hypothetical protein